MALLLLRRGGGFAAATVLAVVVVALVLSCGGGAEAAVRDLRVGYYAETCPDAEAVVRDTMARARAHEARSVASVMRLQFHDCFVNGCDGSVLMDATPTMAGEKEALSNINSLRSFDVVDEIKEALEERCPGVVSCADIIVMAARDAVALVRTHTPSRPAPPRPRPL
jgi:peroxidase